MTIITGQTKITWFFNSWMISKSMMIKFITQIGLEGGKEVSIIILGVIASNNDSWVLYGAIAENENLLQNFYTGAEGTQFVVCCYNPSGKDRGSIAPCPYSPSKIFSLLSNRLTE